jgi:peroxiredoxin
MSSTHRLKPGDHAPDITLLDVHSKPVQLANYWSNGPTLLTFLRHFG